MEDAALASQSCLKLAGLCSGYAAKFMPVMQATHDLVVRRLSRLSEVKAETHGRRKRVQVFHAVAEALYS
jgi:hypothetical protein